MNEVELRNLMFTATQTPKPFTIRYPRGNGVLVDWRQNFELLPIGKGRKLRNGNDLAILSIGHIGNAVAESCEMLDLEGISPAHFDMRFVKPLDEVLLHEIFQQFDKIITVEDGCLQGGFGSAILEFMADNSYNAQIKRLGIPDAIIEHGEQAELQKECGFDANGIALAAQKLVETSLKISY
jgi:1-deoxy-D-xylulose-5-phosphate synthase